MINRYDEYERKVRRIGAAVRRGRGFIHAHRVILTVVLAFLAMLGVAALATGGLIVGETTLSSTVAYGAPPDARTFVILGSARYEYADIDADNWSSDMPRAPGSYRLRAVTKRPFGGADVGDPVRFTIKPKPITIRPFGKDPVWGDRQTPCSSQLIEGDEIRQAEFSVEDMYGKNGADDMYTVISDTVRILDSNGRDVTSAYAVREEGVPITYIPRKVTVTYPDVTTVYDGTRPEVGDGTVTGGTLAPGDDCIATGFVDLPYVGTYTVSANVRFYHGDRDVTAYYHATVKGGNVTIQPRPLTVITGSARKIYDSYPLTCYECMPQDPADLPAGHWLEVYNGTSAFNVGEVENYILRYAIWDSNGTDVTDCFTLTQQPGTLTITPCTVEVTVTGGSYIYDAQPHSARYFVSSTSLPTGMIFVPDELSTLTDVGIIEHPTVESWRIQPMWGGTPLDSSNFDVRFVSESPLEVKPREFVVMTESDTKPYDGQPLDGLDVGFRIVTGWIPDDYELIPGDAARITECGTVENQMTDWQLINMLDGKPVDPKNFTVQVLPGQLTVTVRDVVLSGESITQEYDGQPYTGADHPSLPAPFQNFTVRIIRAIQHKLPGTYSVTPNMNTLMIYDTEGKNVTNCFRLTLDPTWTLTIAPRKITLVTDSVEALYDGLPHSMEQFHFKDKLPVGTHTLTDLVYTSAVHAGVYPNELLSFRVMDGDKDVSAYYDITVEPGEVKILPRTILMESGSDSKVYDGIPLSCEEYRLVEGQDVLLPGHELTIHSMLSVTDAGMYSNVPDKYTVIDTATGEDVSADYTFGGKTGWLTVRKKRISVVTGEATKEYDGKPLTALSVNLDKGFSLAAGDTLSFTSASICYRVEVGTTVNTLEPLIRNRQGKDVTANYEITVLKGKLTVKPRVLTVSVSCHKIYDGEPIDDGDLTLTGLLSGMLVSGHTIRLARYEKHIDVGSFPKFVPSISLLTVWAGNKDVTANYQIVEVVCDVEIVKRPVTLQSNGIKDYDGTPLTSDTVTDVGTPYKLVPGHEVFVTTVGSQTELGTSLNLITSCRIMDKDGVDVTENYSMTLLPGRLTVTIDIDKDPRPHLTVIPYQQTIIYDGIGFHEGNLPFRVSGELPDGCTLTIQSMTVIPLDVDSGDITSVKEMVNIGSYLVTIDEVIVTDRKGQDVTNDFRIISDQTAVVTIQPRKITLTSGSAAKMYDGTPLKNSNVTVTLGELAEGDRLLTTVTGSRTEVGSSLNTFTYRIINSAGKDVTANYTVTTMEGTLTVEE